MESSTYRTPIGIKHLARRQETRSERFRRAGWGQGSWPRPSGSERGYSSTEISPFLDRISPFHCQTRDPLVCTEHKDP